MSNNSLLDRVRSIMKPPVETLKEYDGLVRVISHYDADGITAAGVMVKSLMGAGKRFRLSFVQAVNHEFFENLDHEGYVIILDMGSGQMETIQKLTGTIVILDHHITPRLLPKPSQDDTDQHVKEERVDGTITKGNGEISDDPRAKDFHIEDRLALREGSGMNHMGMDPSKVEVQDEHSDQNDYNIKPIEPVQTENGIIWEFNCHRFGMDGSYAACAASLSYAFASTISRMNSPSTAIALAGIIGDKQSQPLLGLNRAVVMEGISQGYIREKKASLSLDGETVRDALAYAVDPYFRGLTGKESAVDEFLEKMGIQGSKSPDELTLDEKRYLTDTLMVNLLENGSPPESIKGIVGTRYHLSEFGMYADTLSNSLNACGRLDRMTTGVAACLGEKTAMKKATRFREKYRTTVRNGLLYLESRGIRKMDHIQYFYNNDPSSSGAFASLGILYLFDRYLPIIGLSKKEEKIHISSRGTRELVRMGLDLSTAMRKAGTEVGGGGGGHNIAAGATIPKDKDTEFLKLVNDIVGKQLGSG